MIHQISIHVISIHGLCLKFITLSCQLTFGQPSFPASVPIPPEKQKTPWNLWICSIYTWPKRGTYQRGLLPKFTHSMPKSKLSWIGQVAATVLVVATNCYFLLMLVFIPALHWQGRPVRPLPAILGSEMDDSREEENFVAMPAVFCCRGWFLSRKHVLLVIPNVWGLETLFSTGCFSFLLGLQFALEDFPAPACEIHSCDRAVRYAVP